MYKCRLIIQNLAEAAALFKVFKQVKVVAIPLEFGIQRIIPGGLDFSSIFILFFDANSYQHKEYQKIFNIIDDTEDRNFISANENSEIYNFKFKYQGQDIDFIMKSFSPLSKIVKEQIEFQI